MVSVLLAAVLLLMVNYLSYRYHARWDVGWSRYYRLSDKTRAMLAGLDTDVNVIAFLQRGHEMFADVKILLKEYGYEAEKLKAGRLHIEMVDPDRELARTKELKQKYDLSEANVIVVEAGGRRKYLGMADILEYERVVDVDRLLAGAGTLRKKLTAFKGEQAISSAIQSVIQATRPTLYFLAGHGEHDIDDYGKQTGYSGLARTLRRDNMEVKSLLLAERRGVPDDCSALVIAGPDRAFARAEVDWLVAYLNRGGRVLLLIDPAVETGLEPLLEEWGVKVRRDVVVGLTLTGRELVVAAYGEHPITRGLRGVTTVFYMPRSVEPAEPSSDASTRPQADRPRVTVLAANTKEGWAESDLDQNPPRLDAGVDRPGPNAVAVAVEKGAVSGIEAQIRPTRMVAIGDSYFVSNAALGSGVGGSRDLVLNALNWLVEREALMSIGPKVPDAIRLEMSQRQLRMTYLVVVGAVPLVIVIVGVSVWIRRRR
jgi:hypothetical protein